MSEITMNQSVVASYSTHDDAEAAVRQLQQGGVIMNHISIIGRDWQMREDVQGFYRSEDAVLEGAKQGARFGGFFGLFMGIGMFLFPVTGMLLVLGPLAGLIAGAISGAGIGALTSGMMTLGIPQDQAIKYQDRLQAGEFSVVVHDARSDEVTRAHEVLQTTAHTGVASHGSQTELDLAA